MRKVQRAIALAFGMILLVGSWAVARAQTGDCFSSLPGCLDVTFGTKKNGKVVTKIGNNSFAAGLALEPIKQLNDMVSMEFIVRSSSQRRLHCLAKLT